MKKSQSLVPALALFVLLASCSGNETRSVDQENTHERSVDNTVGANATADTTSDMTMADGEGAMMSGGNTAEASISSASGSGLTGKATFTQTGSAVRMVLTVEKATPGAHAVHLHQNGDCSKPDATSAGPHWNPTKNPHGKRGQGQHHAGDLPNMEVGKDGKGKLEVTVNEWKIGGADTTANILNKAVIVHAKADDYQTQPSGDAGDRIGCGIISSGRPQ
jgi:Cu-Zn family superoxide dismutase